MSETVEELRESGMNDEAIEQFKEAEHISNLDRLCERYEKRVLIKDKRIEELEAELEETKELLAENDIEFGDMINQSDRGYEMRYD